MIGQPAPGLLAHPIPSRIAHEHPLAGDKRRPVEPGTIGLPPITKTRDSPPCAKKVEVGEPGGVTPALQRAVTLSTRQSLIPLRDPFVKIIARRTLNDLGRAEVRVFVKCVPAAKRHLPRSRLDINFPVKNRHPAVVRRGVYPELRAMRHRQLHPGSCDGEFIIA